MGRTIALIAPVPFFWGTVEMERSLWEGTLGDFSLFLRKERNLERRLLVFLLFDSLEGTYRLQSIAAKIECIVFIWQNGGAPVGS